LLRFQLRSWRRSAAGVIGLGCRRVILNALLDNAVAVFDAQACDVAPEPRLGLLSIGHPRISLATLGEEASEIGHVCHDPIDIARRPPARKTAICPESGEEQKCAAA